MKKIILLALLVFIPNLVLASTLTPECSCVIFAHSLNSQVAPISAKWYRNLNNSVPVIGGLIIFKYPNDYHVATIIDYSDEGFVVLESNYRKCQVDKRVVAYNDKNIIGFFKPANV